MVRSGEDFVYPQLRAHRQEEISSELRTVIGEERNRGSVSVGPMVAEGSRNRQSRDRPQRYGFRNI
jgi:hypothetical protein